MRPWPSRSCSRPTRPPRTTSGASPRDGCRAPVAPRPGSGRAAGRPAPPRRHPHRRHLGPRAGGRDRRDRLRLDRDPDPRRLAAPGVRLRRAHGTPVASSWAAGRARRRAYPAARLRAAADRVRRSTTPTRRAANVCCDRAQRSRALDQLARRSRSRRATRVAEAWDRGAMSIRYECRRVTTGADRLHAEDRPPRAGRRLGRTVERHSLGGTARRRPLVGFVNVAWDGAVHAFILDTLVAATHRRHGIATELVGVATDQARSAGCEWLHVDFDDDLREFYFGACGFAPDQRRRSSPRLARVRRARPSRSGRARRFGSAPVSSGRRAVGCEAPPAGGGDHRRVVGAHRRGWAGSRAARRPSHASRNCSRSSELAATPPPRHEAVGADLGRRPAGLGHEHVDHRLLERRRRRRPCSTSGCLRDVVARPRLQPAEREVEAVVEHRPREARSPSGRPPWRRGRSPGRPGSRGRGSGRPCRTPRRRRRRWSGRAAR